MHFEVGYLRIGIGTEGTEGEGEEGGWRTRVTGLLTLLLRLCRKYAWLSSPSLSLNSIYFPLRYLKRFFGIILF